MTLKKLAENSIWQDYELKPSELYCLLIIFNFKPDLIPNDKFQLIDSKLPYYRPLRLMSDFAQMQKDLGWRKTAKVRKKCELNWEDIWSDLQYKHPCLGEELAATLSLSVQTSVCVVYVPLTFEPVDGILKCHHPRSNESYCTFLWYCLLWVEGGSNFASVYDSIETYWTVFCYGPLHYVIKGGATFESVREIL